MLSRTRGLIGSSALRQDLLRGGAVSLAVRSANAVLAFAVAVTLARLLGPDGYGVYAFAIALLMIVALPAQVGVPQLVVRETAKAQADGDWSLTLRLWQWANRTVILFSSVTLAGILAVLWLGAASSRLETLAVGAALVPLIALGNLRAASLRGLGRVVMGQLPESVIRPLVLIAILLTAAGLEVEKHFMTPQAAMGAYSAAALTAFVAGAMMLRRVRPAKVIKAAARITGAEWRRAVLPLAMISGLHVVNNQADIIVLGIFRSDDEVGIYRAVFQMSLLVVFGLQAMNQMLQPHFARLYRQSDMARLQRLVTLGARSILALALLPVLAFVFFGGDLLAWAFGDAYRLGAVALAILALGQLAKAVWGYSGTLLTMCGFESVAFYSAVAATSLNICLNFILVPYYGMPGAALSTSVTFIVWHIILVFHVWRRIKLRDEFLRFS